MRVESFVLIKISAICAANEDKVSYKKHVLHNTFSKYKIRSDLKCESGPSSHFSVPLEIIIALICETIFEREFLVRMKLIACSTSYNNISKYLNII